MAHAWLLLLPLTGQQAALPPAGAEHFLPSHAEVAAAYAELAAAHPELVELEHVGASRGGRKIEALRIAAPGVAADAPGILLVANLSGDRLFASGVALHHARRLAEGYADDEAVRALLDANAVYVIAAPNPDAAAARFTTPLDDRARVGHGVDDDRDGREGEDPPADVDGDGLVTSIRVEDPDGEWRLDADDPRVMVKADRTQGERGTHSLYTEGRDSDGDERVAEDAVHDTRLSANFSAGWKQHAPEAGLFPGDEPEARALMDFCLLHPSLALVVCYDELDTLVDPPKGIPDDAPRVKRIPKPGFLESDAKLLAELGKRYRETTKSEAKGAKDDSGSFQRWAYEHRGLFVLGATLWEMPTKAPDKEAPDKEDGGAAASGDAGDDSAEAPAAAAEEPSEEAAEAPEEARPAGRPGRGGRGGGRGGPPPGGGSTGGGPKKDAGPDPSLDGKHLKWVDAVGESWRFDPWEAFEHPELGPCEVGGFAPFAKVEPPADERQGIADRHLEFLASLADVPARVSVASLEAEALADGLWRVTLELENDSYLPLLSTSGKRTRTTRPAKVQLVLPEGASLLSGSPFELVSDLEGSGGRSELVWLVGNAPNGGIGVRVDTDHAGDVSRQAEVVR